MFLIGYTNWQAGWNRIEVMKGSIWARTQRMFPIGFLHSEINLSGAELLGSSFLPLKDSRLSLSPTFLLVLLTNLLETSVASAWIRFGNKIRHL